MLEQSSLIGWQVPEWVITLAGSPGELITLSTNLGETAAETQLLSGFKFAERQILGFPREERKGNKTTEQKIAGVVREPTVRAIAA